MVVTIPAIILAVPTAILYHGTACKGTLSCAKLAVPVRVDTIITGMVNHLVLEA